MTEAPDITIPPGLLPSDGRFGSGPSKVRPEQVKALASVADTYLGTSHRQPAVKHVVARLRGSDAISIERWNRVYQPPVRQHADEG